MGVIWDFIRDLLASKDEQRTRILHARCAWAEWSPARKKRHRRMTEVWGAVVHTTGSGVLRAANEHGTSSVEEALRVYHRTAGPHYVVDYDGTVFQIQYDDLWAAHCGVSRAERKAYLNGTWREAMFKLGRSRGTKLWSDRWGPKKSPQHLYPTKSPNACYVGIEMVTLDGSTGIIRFTADQHKAVALLLCDLARRYKWPKGWSRSARLLGHEDIDAFDRWDRRGGWDPGALREHPRFDWAVVRKEIDRLCPGERLKEV